VVALVGAGAGLIGCRDRKPHFDHALFETPVVCEARVLEHPQHRGVLREDLRDELFDARDGRVRCETFEQPRADAAPL
jgi:hypothetical protein